MRDRWLRFGARGVVTLLVAAGWAAGAGADEARPARVTSVIGEARGGDEPLADQAVVAAHERLVTGEAGKCSLLVDGDMVLQLCEKTSAVIREDPRDGRRIVQLDAGTLRVIAEPRLARERIEIHTPAAIATLLGTIVNVHVDETTGATTVTPTHSAVSVRSADGDVPGETKVGTAEQITVLPGSPPPEHTRRLASQQLRELERCVAELRDGTLVARGDQEDDALVRLVEGDARDARRLDLRDPGAAADELRRSPPPPGDDPNDLQDVCAPLECSGALPAPPVRGNLLGGG